MPATSESEHTALVRDLLAHLHDYGYCAKHSLIAWVPERSGSRVERMRILRQCVLETIESMRPRPGTLPSAPSARSYQVLRKHYVEGHLIKEIASEFSLSPRQLYRYLRRAEQDLTALLRTRLSPTPALDPASSAGGLSRAELLQKQTDRLSGQVRAVPVGAAIDSVLQLSARLAEERRVELHYASPTDDLVVLANPQLLHYALLNTLSHCIRQATMGSKLCIGAGPANGGVQVVVDAKTIGSPLGRLPDEVERLVDSAGGTVHTRIEGGEGCHTLTFPAQSRRTLLVIDDNAGMGELVRRYLTNSQYTVDATTDGRQGLTQAIAAPPDVILLDVLLGDEDGWQILQQLKAKPETERVPVIVCSVFNDPDLARSLGASGYCTKPLRRPQLLSVLNGVEAEANSSGC